ncbi:MAG: DUF5110 domain-containing protein [Candidatus Adiutrix sp.]|jgi:alpha-glucosidase|nr:DUF5110 domain-containing protein [Candidatus Adiutrix sp.]
MTWLKKWLPLIIWLAAGPGAVLADAPDRSVVRLGNYSLSLALVGEETWLFELTTNKVAPGQPLEMSVMVDPAAGVRPAPSTSAKGWTWAGPASQVTLNRNPSSLTISRTEGEELLTLAPFSPDGRLAGLAFRGPFSHLLGLGADFRLQSDTFNLLGQTILPGGPFGNARLTNWAYRPNQVQIPIVYGLGEGLKCAALFVDETLPLQWNFKNTPWTVTAAGPLRPGDTLRFFVITGPDLPALRKSFMDLVGRPPVPPRRLMGVWVSGLKEARARDVPAEDMEEDRPEPAGVLDLPSPELREKLARLRQIIPNFSGLTVEAEAEVPALLAAAKAENLGLILDESSRIPQHSPHYPEMSRRSFLVRNGEPGAPPLSINHFGRLSGLIDYTNSAAAAFWHSLEREKLTAEGQTYFRLLDSDLENVGPEAWYAESAEDSLHSHYAWANAYALKWMEGIENRLTGWRGQNARPLFMTRTGTAGLARRSGFLYNGETSIFSGGFAGLSYFGVRSHLALAGIDYYSSDLASALDSWPVARFFQSYDAWLARTVLTDFPLILPEELVSRPAFQYNLALRESLSPYIYNLAWQAWLDGRPVTAPLVYYFQEDIRARDRLPEIMLGPSLLVSLNLDGNSERTKVYVPRGRWYDWRSGEVIDQAEGGEVDLDTKVGGQFTPPILARAGAIIPAVEYLEPKEGLAERIDALKIFIGEETSETSWFEDDGLSQRYRQGDRTSFGRTAITAVTQPDGSTVVTIKARQGAWSEAPSERPLLIDIYGPRAPGQATLDNLPHNRVAQASALDRMESGWASFGQNRIRFKTPPLNLNTDHVLWFK